MPELTVAVGLVVFINGVFSYWQQYRAQRAVDVLESLLPRRVSVRLGAIVRRRRSAAT
jgi:Ca2+-transporting ATPase